MCYYELTEAKHADENGERKMSKNMNTDFDEKKWAALIIACTKGKKDIFFQRGLLDKSDAMIAAFKKKDLLELVKSSCEFVECANKHKDLRCREFSELYRYAASGIA